MPWTMIGAFGADDVAASGGKTRKLRFQMIAGFEGPSFISGTALRLSRILDTTPHRSVRALLTHTAPTSDEWRQSCRWRTPAKPLDIPKSRTVPGACGSD